MMNFMNPNWYQFKTLQHHKATGINKKGGQTTYRTYPLTLNLDAPAKTHEECMEAARAVAAGEAPAADHGVHGVSAYAVLPYYNFHDFKQMEYDHIIKGVIADFMKHAVKAMGKAGRDELHRRMRDTRRARGFQLIHDWSKRTTGGKIHVIFQWFLHSSPADLSGLMDAVHARLWCECACSRQMPRARCQLRSSPYLAAQHSPHGPYPPPTQHSSRPGRPQPALTASIRRHRTGGRAPALPHCRSAARTGLQPTLTCSPH